MTMNDNVAVSHDPYSKKSPGSIFGIVLFSRRIIIQYDRERRVTSPWTTPTRGRLEEQAPTTTTAVRMLMLTNGVPTATRCVRITRVSVPFVVRRFNSDPYRNLGNHNHNSSNRNSSDVLCLRHKRQPPELPSYDSSWEAFDPRLIR
jgi:hypothetical protein